ncbi:MetQ/NlpA family ABC transporter substrate-binding protein [Nostoc sp.]|uniref:MetQ/NlpA family ABC transporter substrate-binding protein n=1 Tax=Nostoc sp. TaxID=1180 RepID=UPI002FF8AC3B
MNIQHTKINRRFFLRALTLFSVSIFFVSCSQQQAQVSSNTAQATAQKKVIQIGVTGIISEDILKFINTKLAPQEGLEVKVVTFNDWIQPNTALIDKVIDANFFQHRPFMNNTVRELKINLVPLNLVYLSTLGFFSKWLKSVNDVPQNATVTIAHDVINNDRGLRLIVSNGLIKLKENTKKFVTTRDIAENPKSLQIKEVAGVQVVQAINDVDFIVSSAQTVALAEITPQSMGQEIAKDKKYALALVTLQGRENEPKIQKLNKLLNDPQVRDFINNQCQGRIVPVF